MKIGERGQVTIPKALRERFGMGPHSEVEFIESSGTLVLRKAPRKSNFARWKGYCAQSFVDLGYSSVDQFMEDIRGR